MHHKYRDREKVAYRSVHTRDDLPPSIQALENIVTAAVIQYPCRHAHLDISGPVRHLSVLCRCKHYSLPFKCNICKCRSPPRPCPVPQSWPIIEFVRPPLMYTYLATGPTACRLHYPGVMNSANRNDSKGWAVTGKSHCFCKNGCPIVPIKRKSSIRERKVIEDEIYFVYGVLGGWDCG